MGHLRRGHALLHRVGDGSPSLPVDRARVPEHHRTRGGASSCVELGVDAPDVVVACVGGGSNAAGIFAGFANTSSRLVGIEAAGGSAVGSGSPGVLHGMRSLLMQDEFGQIEEAHSISAGLDYPGHRSRARPPRRDRARGVLRHRRRRRHRRPATAQREGGDHPGPRDGARRRVDGPRGGRRHPDRLDGAAQSLRSRRQGRRPSPSDTARRVVKTPRTRLTRRTDSGRKLLVPYFMGGLTGDWTEHVEAAVLAGADAVEIGIPFSDPMMDGPVIQEADLRALANGTHGGLDL